MALDHLGQRLRRRRLARRLRLVLLVRHEFRQLQQNLWLARRDHRLYDLDVGVDHRRAGRRQARRRNRAPAPRPPSDRPICNWRVPGASMVARKARIRSTPHASKWGISHETGSTFFTDAAARAAGASPVKPRTLHRRQETLRQPPLSPMIGIMLAAVETAAALGWWGSNREDASDERFTRRRKDHDGRQLLVCSRRASLACRRLGSYGGRYNAFNAAKWGVRGVIMNDAGIGKDNAGIRGSISRPDHLAAATADAQTCHIGDGDHMLEHGVISHVNRAAAALGCTPGQSVRDCADSCARQMCRQPRRRASPRAPGSSCATFPASRG